jgi:hypothetical protein
MGLGVIFQHMDALPTAIITILHSGWHFLVSIYEGEHVVFVCLWFILLMSSSFTYFAEITLDFMAK